LADDDVDLGVETAATVIVECDLKPRRVEEPDEGVGGAVAICEKTDDEPVANHEVEELDIFRRIGLHGDEGVQGERR